MPPADELPWERLAAYLAGEVPPDEARQIEAWAAATPEREALVAELRRIWSAAEGEVPVPDVEVAIARLRAQVNTERAARRASDRVRFTGIPAATRPIRHALLAAGLAALALGGWWLVEHRAATPPSRGTYQALREYATARGQRLRLNLPDGTGVLLAPESSLRLAADYGDSTRVVTLDGEGYFTVAHEATRPFEVRTPYAVARDLGTRFLVRARPAESRVRVIVAEGKVQLSGAARRTDVVLRPADLGEVKASGEVTRREGVDLRRWLAWTEGRQVFSRTRLDALVPELERWYDVRISLADPGLESRTFTGTFGDEPVTEVLEVVRASLGLRLERSGQRFVLRAAPAPSS